MLKALELCGFKSFADKTRFEFPPGITVVVGPNGSGKSNIVDGIKWVLGEQSAKSLRGREMADCIFKGSGGGSGGRRPANTAEVTIVFDNEAGLLPVETPEVRVTRRVYRSGEGEYLINDGPCRLRDVKDLFRGTGMGTDAYSLIEQGKVDTLLQASPRDRRAIFEEAAGISRFKAKKVETQRRLQRVEQNLERLSDIVDEVDSQLRTVRNQASKARRYREFTDRLKALRTHVGRTDWRRLSADLAGHDESLEQLQSESTQLRDEVAATSQQVADQRSGLTALNSTLRESETAAADVASQLAGHASTIAHARHRIAELDGEIARYQQQSSSLQSRAGELDGRLSSLRDESAAATTAHEAAHDRLKNQSQLVQEAESALQSLVQQRSDQEQEHAHQLRISADLGRRIGMSESELQAVDQQLTTLQQRQTQLAEDLTAARTAQTDLEATESELSVHESDARTELKTARQGLHEHERQVNELQQLAVDLQRTFTAARERANVLEELERRREGLGGGVKDLLKRAEDAPLGALATIDGLVADLIRVDVEMAPLIDTVLGEMSQYVVVHGPQLIHEVASGEIPIDGRVGLIDRTTEAKPDNSPELAADAAVLGRADEYVEAPPEYASLIDNLLGRTWCVATLADALRLRRQFGPGRRFVSRAGELVDDHGRALLGPRQAALGLVSRRSELRSLRLKIVDLEPQINSTDTKIAELKQQIADSEIQVTNLTTQYDEAASALMQARLETRGAVDRTKNLNGLLEQLAEEIQELGKRREEADLQRLEQITKLEAVNETIEALEQQRETHVAQLRQLEESREAEQTLLTELKVETATTEQRMSALQGELERLEHDRDERTRAADDARSQLLAARDRYTETNRTILRSSASQAELFLAAEQYETTVRKGRRERTDVEAAVAATESLLQRAQQRLAQLDEQRHQIELRRNEVRLERETLRQRVQEDYQIDLSDLDEEPELEEDSPEALERAEIDREIGDLRRKLSNIGAVNMAALEEIDALETRHQNLAAQYQDLVDAKDALARIIHKINADSRRLFTESLELIRTNFQALFRRVFGGGHADIVLEEDADILEAGIDIVATPPGKHSLGISLLSGGERALTAVTLLLAIFQYRPSPFCVLDEVDGPLDEANIGRFVDVLREFLEWTKFVVVTHSKKTMTAASTLYGVTMQESGISKRVSVRFEDVSEDGHIRAEAIQRDSDPGPGDGGDERGAA